MEPPYRGGDWFHHDALGYLRTPEAATARRTLEETVEALAFTRPEASQRRAKHAPTRLADAASIGLLYALAATGGDCCARLAWLDAHRFLEAEESPVWAMSDSDWTSPQLTPRDSKRDHRRLPRIRPTGRLDFKRRRIRMPGRICFFRSASSTDESGVLRPDFRPPAAPHHEPLIQESSSSQFLSREISGP